MKSKYKILLISGIFIFSLSLLSSCYTKKKGVVPCPTWGQTEQLFNQNTNQILVSE